MKTGAVPFYAATDFNLPVRTVKNHFSYVTLAAAGTKRTMTGCSLSLPNRKLLDLPSLLSIPDDLIDNATLCLLPESLLSLSAVVRCIIVAHCCSFSHLVMLKGVF